MKGDLIAGQVEFGKAGDGPTMKTLEGMVMGLPVDPAAPTPRELRLAWELEKLRQAFEVRVSDLLAANKRITEERRSIAQERDDVARANEALHDILRKRETVITRLTAELDALKGDAA